MDNEQTPDEVKHDEMNERDAAELLGRVHDYIAFHRDMELVHAMHTAESIEELRACEAMEHGGMAAVALIEHLMFEHNFIRPEPTF